MSSLALETSRLGGRFRSLQDIQVARVQKLIQLQVAFKAGGFVDWDIVCLWFDVVLQLQAAFNLRFLRGFRWRHFNKL